MGAVSRDPETAKNVGHATSLGTSLENRFLVEVTCRVIFRRGWILQEMIFVLQSIISLPEWRNWQTRWIQNPVGATPWEFKSHLWYFLRTLRQGSLSKPAR